jgi:hypothetical protein
MTQHFFGCPAQEAFLAKVRALAGPLVPQVPGLAEHAAAEAQVNM